MFSFLNEPASNKITIKKKLPNKQDIQFRSSKKLNQKGQTLIEYLIIVAILGVGSIFIMGAMGQQVNRRFGKIIKALDGNVDNSDLQGVQVRKNQLSRKNLSNFENGTDSN